MRKTFAVFFLLFSMYSSFGWFWSFLARLGGPCRMYIVFCQGDYKLGDVAFKLGDSFGFISMVLWNQGFMPHSPDVLYPEWLAAIIYIGLLFVSIHIVRKTFL